MTPQKLIALLQEALEHHKAGRLPQAAALYARIRAAAPRNFDAVHLAGTLELQQGRAEEAAATLALARKLDPRSAVCAMRLGVANNALGRYRDAEAALRAAVKLDPRLPEGWLHLGRSLEQLGRLHEAVEAAERAVALRPDYPEAHDQLGILLVASRGYAAAEPHFRRAVESEPRFARAWSNLGISLVFIGRLSEAVQCFDRALSLDPGFHHAYAGRGLALERMYKIREAVADYGRAIEGDPNDLQAHSARLMALHYLDGVSREQLFREHVRFGQALETGAQASRPCLPPEDTGETPVLHSPSRPLRVGFLSPNFRTHSVAAFFEPLLAHLDRDQFETFLYHDHPKLDATSERLRATASHWRHVAGMPHGALEALIRGDRLDILVDLAGHTELNRLAVFARRVAPVQATYLGYPDTTGLTEMDYRLVDEITDPPGEADRTCTERLLRFAPTAWCYQPPADAPEPSPGPAARGEPVTFGCFNNFAKVTDEALKAWGRILAAVPGSRLLLKGHGLTAPTLKADAERRFAAAGLDPGRVELLDRVASQRDHLAAYSRVDVALDTFPYHGTTTTCEALWMGVPVVTLAGDRHASRVGISLLKAVGRSEWIAETWDHYAHLAALVSTATEFRPDRLALQAEMGRSDLMNVNHQGRRFEAALRRMRAESKLPGRLAELTILE